MLLFRSEEHVDAWLEPRDRDRGAVLTLEQGWQLASRWYADRLDRDWDRPTPDQVTAILEELGLTGPFWRLAP